MKAYRVDFNYTISSQASMYVCAENEEAAKAGAQTMLDKSSTNYADAEIVSVSEYEVETPDTPTIQ